MAGPERRQARIPMRRSAERDAAEVLFVDLLAEGVSEPVDARDVEPVFVDEFPKPLAFLDRGVPVIEFLKPMGWLGTNPLPIDQSLALSASVIDDELDHDESDLRDGPLTSERGEVEVDHDPEGSIAFPRGYVQRVTERVRDPDLVETMHPFAVSLHRLMSFLV